MTYLDRIPNRLTINNKPSRRELSEIELIKKMIRSYYEVVKKNINDIIPKTIITFLVKKVRKIALNFSSRFRSLRRSSSRISMTPRSWTI